MYLVYVWFQPFPAVSYAHVIIRETAPLSCCPHLTTVTCTIIDTLLYNPAEAHIHTIPDYMQFSALWDPLPDSSPCTPTRWCPVGRGASGGPGSIPGPFWRTGVPSIRRDLTEPLHSGSVKYRDVVWSLH